MPATPARRSWPARLAGLGVALAVVAIFVGALIVYLPEFRARAAQEEHARELEAEIAAEQQRERDLKDHMAAVKADPKVLERLAREKFGLGRTGEMVFRFETSSTNVPAARRP
ncbi:MAG: FtsB family cell division protein [Limisphaerales bacterium]